MQKSTTYFDKRAWEGLIANLRLYSWDAGDWMRDTLPTLAKYLPAGPILCFPPLPPTGQTIRFNYHAISQ